MILSNPFILLVLVPGGWDSSMVFDSKIDSPYVSIEEGSQNALGAKQIPYVDHPNRPSVKKWFDTYGGNASIVKGLYTGSLDRLEALEKSLSAVPPEKSRPVDWLTFYSANLNPTLLAPHFVIDSPYFPGHLGATVISTNFSQIRALEEEKIDENKVLPEKNRALIESFRKTELTKFMSNIGEGTLDGDKYSSLYAASIRHTVLQKSLKEIMVSLKSSKQCSDFCVSGKIAIEMFARGYSLAATISHKDPSYWETYENHFTRQSTQFESLFSDLLEIMDYSKSKEILSSTVIIVMSERGRAPRINAKYGKESWPYTSLLLWGPGIKPASIGGQTDAALRGIPIDPLFGSSAGANPVLLEPAHVFSGLFMRYNLPSKLLIPNIKPLSTIIEMETKN